MRIIATLDDETLARKFSSFLQGEKIENSCEVTLDSKTGKPTSIIWVHNEDELEKANQFYQEFEKNPNDPRYHTVIEKEPLAEEAAKAEDISEAMQTEMPVRRRKSLITMFLFSICAAIYLLNFMQQTVATKEGKRQLFSPFQLTFLYDVPANIVLLNKLIRETDFDFKTKAEDIPQDIQSKLKEIESIPTWQGIYPHFLPKKATKGALKSYPPFTQIRQGEVWRLLSPAFLHLSFLHIAFNMIWLWVLGKQIEMRLSAFKYLLLVVLIGVFSNTCQYLMGGPLFLGFSGIVVGLAGFIYSRQKVAPWEGHMIHKSTFIFLSFYILIMFGVQLFSYFMQLFGSGAFPGFIANTAHISGGILGLILGRLKMFSWRPVER